MTRRKNESREDYLARKRDVYAKKCSEPTRQKIGEKTRLIAEASAKGLLTYMGFPCKRGHSGERYLNGECIICSRERGHDRHMANPGKTTLRMQKWRKNNPEKAREVQWRKQNILSAKYPGEFLKWPEYKEQFNEQGGLCGGCEKMLDITNSNDCVPDHCHETFVFRGVLCSTCNWREGFAASPLGRKLAQRSAAFLEKQKQITVVMEIAPW